MAMLQAIAKADFELVIGQYEKGFIETINGVAAQGDKTFRSLIWQDMDWDDAEAA